MRQEFKVKDRHNLTGRGRTKWKFYNSLNEILGSRPATRPAVTLDTSDDTSKLDDGDDPGSGEEEDVDEAEMNIQNEDEGLTPRELESDEPECESI